MVEKNNLIMFTGDPSDPSQMMKYMKEGIPVLVSYNMAVKSSRKLVAMSG
jgi:2,3-bisphosphoglycerate-independent phosphoglycerate mutase